MQADFMKDTKIENYKTLTNGFIYRKVKSDVEINIYYTNNDNPYTMPQYGNTVVGTLPEDYRPKNGILLPIFGRNIGNGTIYETLIEIRTDGQVRLVNGHGPACQVSQIHGFVKYSVL